MGSNKTVQQVLNAGYTILGTAQVKSNNPAVHIPALTGTNKIIIQVSVINSRFCYLGTSTVDDTNGFCINPEIPVEVGGILDTKKTGRPYEFLTSKPEDFYLFSNGDVNVDVIYLTEI